MVIAVGGWNEVNHLHMTPGKPGPSRLVRRPPEPLVQTVNRTQSILGHRDSVAAQLFQVPISYWGCTKTVVFAQPARNGRFLYGALGVYE
jgi:hypothetical protein